MSTTITIAAPVISTKKNKRRSDIALSSAEVKTMKITQYTRNRIVKEYKNLINDGYKWMDAPMAHFRIVAIYHLKCNANSMFEYNPSSCEDNGPFAALDRMISGEIVVDQILALNLNDTTSLTENMIKQEIATLEENFFSGRFICTSYELAAIAFYNVVLSA